MRSGALCTLFLSRMKLTSPFFCSGATASTAMSTPTALGSTTFDQRTSRSCPLPGSAQRGLLLRCPASASAIVRENVLLRPAGEVEERARRQEIEAVLGELRPFLAGE